MTKQYVETFYNAQGAFTDLSDRLTSHWNLGASGYGLSTHSPAVVNFQSKLVAEDREVTFIASSSFVAGRKEIGGLSITRVADHADGQVAAAFQVRTEAAAYPDRSNMVFARGRGFGLPTDSAYFARLHGREDTREVKVQLYKYVADVPTLINESTKAFAAGSGLLFAHCRMQLIGTDIKVRYWEMGTAEPAAWDLEESDAAIALAGAWGAGVANPADLLGDFPIDPIYYISVVDVAGTDCYIPREHDVRWRLLEENRPLILFEAGVLGTSDGGTTGVDSTMCLSTGGFVTLPGDRPANTLYEGRISEVAEFSQRMNEQLQGKTTQGFGTITINNNDGKLKELLSYNWDGRPFRLLVGLRGWRYCEFSLVASGTLERVEQTSQNRIVFRLRDGSNLLSRRYTDILVGGPEAANASKFSPLPFGKVFNIPALLYDSGANQYVTGSASNTDVRENGNSIFGSVTTPVGAGFTVSATPQGEVTCDSDNGTGATIDGVRMDSPLGMFYALTSGALTPAQQFVISQFMNVPQIQTLNDDPAGIYIDSSGPFIDVKLEQLVIGENGFSAWSRWGEIYPGKLVLAPTPSDDDLLFSRDEMLRRKFVLKRLILPQEPRRASYRQNYTVQNAAGLAGVVTPPDRALYSSPNTIVDAVESVISGLARYTNHNLYRRNSDPIATCYFQNTNGFASDIAEGDHANWNKQVGVFEFETRRYAQRVEIGLTARITHEAFGFEDQIGVIVGYAKNIKKGTVKIEWATQLDDQWPDSTAAYPYVGTPL